MLGNFQAPKTGDFLVDDDSLFVRHLVEVHQFVETDEKATIPGMTHEARQQLELIVNRSIVYNRANPQGGARIRVVNSPRIQRTASDFNCSLPSSNPRQYATTTSTKSYPTKAHPRTMANRVEHFLDWSGGAAKTPVSSQNLPLPKHGSPPFLLYLQL